MPWLLRGDRVLANIEIADSASGRARGLLGRTGLDGAMLLEPAPSVHTIGMKFPIDVAHCVRSDDHLVVRHIQTLEPNRMGRPHPRARVVIEAESGSFERWGLVVGDELSISGEGATGDGMAFGVTA